MNLIRLVATACLLIFGVACERKATTSAQETTPTTAIAVKVDGTGYHPGTVSAPAGRPVRLTITRTSDEGCGQQIIFPSLNIRKDLQLNQAVNVDFTMPASGSVAFTCGMDMWRGSVVAR